jgi:MYXO-CTERM domain-containing protein
MKKLNTTFLAGALVAAMLPGVAAAQDLGSARAYEVILASETQDLAPTRLYEDGIRRLRKTDEEFTNEQATVRFSPDGKYAAVISMWTGVVNEGTAREASPPNRMQCAMQMMEMVQDPISGEVAMQKLSTDAFAKFITNNNGNEYRQCNKPEILTINGGKNFLVEYNYQPQGTNDTRRYAQVYKWDGTKVTTKNGQGQVQQQVQVQAKNNDDCSMHQSGAGQAGLPYFQSVVGPNFVTRYATWDGCNGNGRDDGWARATQVSCLNDAAGVASECTITKLFDLSLAQREERSRGRCTVGGADQSFAVCTWTEGNNQPQREGVWMAAVDLSQDGQMGADANGRLLWKERLIHRQNLTVNGEEREYYAMRAQHGRILEKQADGSLLPGADIIFQATGNRGGNNNDKKGGRSDIMNFAVINATRTGYTYVMPMANINMGTSPMLLGLDGTHISMSEAVFGKGDQLIPGFTQLQGSQTGGLQQDADIRTIGYDPATKTILNLGQHSAAASYDRHLYSNYLGNNPGNQGRNFAGSDVVKNPFFGIAGNQVQYFTAYAVTGKAPMHTSSAIKPSLYLSMLPIAFSATAPDPQGGYNDNVPGDENNDDPVPEEPDPLEETKDGFASGGCSTGGSSSGFLGLALVGLALTIRRRRNA